MVQTFAAALRYCSHIEKLSETFRERENLMMNNKVKAGLHDLVNEFAHLCDLDGGFVLPNEG